jgi:phage terminase large subunit-like protein
VTRGERIAPALAALRDPAFLATLTETERYVLPFVRELWLRPEQHVPAGPWRYCGGICGRGWGKTHAFATEINRRVEAGEAKHIGLMAPTDERIDQLQCEFLINAAPPWFKPERYKGGVRWPNGVVAIAFSAEAPDLSRGENLDLAWLSEIVAWKAGADGKQRMLAFNNITTATRVGRAQVFWDTTSKGKNDVIFHLLDLHKDDPDNYPIVRGSMFDNPFLSKAYLRAEFKKYPRGRRRDEEIYGKVFDEADGALWQQAWIDQHRRIVVPTARDLKLVSVDPAMTTGRDADDTGIIVGERSAGHAYTTHDLSGKHTPDQWGDIVCDQYEAGAAGVVAETNRGGLHIVANIRARAGLRGIQVRELHDPTKPFPTRTPGVLYVRTIRASDSKETRAYAPASMTESGLVHMVGVFDDLELELTTYEPGTGQRSPNRYDAFAYLILELLDLDREAKPDGKKAIKGTTAAYDVLRQSMRELRRSRPIG